MNIEIGENLSTIITIITFSLTAIAITYLMLKNADKIK